MWLQALTFNIVIHVFYKTKNSCLKDFKNAKYYMETWKSIINPILGAPSKTVNL